MQSPSHQARTARASELAALLQDSRARTLALAKAYATALGPHLTVPYSTEINPPLWELGHIAWFQEHWIARNPQRHLGVRANPDCPRGASLRDGADALYNSSTVPHTSRWTLPLPNLTATLHDLNQGLSTTLRLLHDTPDDDAALYFYRLALFHEDMHNEAAVYMAQSLGVHLPAELQAPGARASALSTATQEPTCTVPAGDWLLGYDGATTPGFAFDNELGAHPVTLPAFEIDRHAVTWARYLEYLDAPRTTDAAVPAIPRYLRRRTGHHQTTIWEQCRFGTWQPLDLSEPACHLSYSEVQAWCRWAGRQLPTEAQWEKAACTQPEFAWGDVWEWTASSFDAYPGFEAHPYRDYSAPWFGSRPALRGASRATVARMAHPRYRNFFTGERTDIYAGFRTCVAGAKLAVG